MVLGAQPLGRTAVDELTLTWCGEQARRPHERFTGQRVRCRHYLAELSPSARQCVR